MADQTRNAVVTALKALIETQASIGTVYDGPEAITALPEDALPACLIIEGDHRVRINITSTRDIIQRFGIPIYYKGDESDARTREDALIKLLEQNVTVSNTAINSYVMPSETPFLWPDYGLKFRGVIFEVWYRQDAPT